ncbi:MAG: MMPL family transporter, partial [Rhodospirillales bacterium]|nr:MMPL family transporter [Rhodospirillales bacterium]
PAQAEAIAKKLSGLPEVDGTTSLAQFIPKNQARKLEMIESAAFFLAPALADGNRAPPPTDEARAKSIRDLMGKLDGASALAKTLKDFTAKPVALTTLETRLLTGLPGRLLALRQSLDAEEITLKTLPPGLIRRQVAEDGRARLEVHPKEDLRDRNSLAQFVRAVRAHAPQATGAPVVILEAGQAVLASFFQAGLLTLLAITLVLALLFARLREILLIFAPLVLAGLLTVAAGLIFDLPFNFANVIVLPLLFGLGVAGGVHFVSRERAGGDTQAVLASSTPRAVTFSALTTIGSFGSIALSSHPGTASMGLLLTIAIILVLISTLLVLPALMATWPASRRPMRPI